MLVERPKQRRGEAQQAVDLPGAAAREDPETRVPYPGSAPFLKAVGQQVKAAKRKVLGPFGRGKSIPHTCDGSCVTHHRFVESVRLSHWRCGKLRESFTLLEQASAPHSAIPAANT